MLLHPRGSPYLSLAPPPHPEDPGSPSSPSGPSWPLVTVCRQPVVTEVSLRMTDTTGSEGDAMVVTGPRRYRGLWLGRQAGA